MQMKGRQEAGDWWQSRAGYRLQEGKMGESTGRQVTGCGNGKSTVL